MITLDVIESTNLTQQVYYSDSGKCRYCCCCCWSCRVIMLLKWRIYRPAPLSVSSLLTCPFIEQPARLRINEPGTRLRSFPSASFIRLSATNKWKPLFHHEIMVVKYQNNSWNKSSLHRFCRYPWQSCPWVHFCDPIQSDPKLAYNILSSSANAKKDRKIYKLKTLLVLPRFSKPSKWAKRASFCSNFVKLSSILIY